MYKAQRGSRRKPRGLRGQLRTKGLLGEGTANCGPVGTQAEFHLIQQTGTQCLLDIERGLVTADRAVNRPGLSPPAPRRGHSPSPAPMQPLGLPMAAAAGHA